MNTYTRLTALKDDVIVDPLYDPDKVQSGLSPGAPALWLPDSAKNPMSSQGIVVAVGPDQKDVEEGDHVLFHPFVASPFKVRGYEYFRVAQRHLVGWLDADGTLYPLPDDVVLLPTFPPRGITKQGGLWLPRQFYGADVPCSGKVTATGTRVSVVSVGQQVVFPPKVGNEVGLTRVFYTMKATDLLAVIDATQTIRAVVTSAHWQQEIANA